MLLVTFAGLSTLTSCQLDKLFSGGIGEESGITEPPPGGSEEPVASRLSVVVQPAATQQNQNITPAFQVAAVDNAGQTVTTYTGNITVEIATNPSSGVLSGTLSRAAANGVATFSGLSIDKVGTGYRLRASAGGLTSVTSAAFDITAAPPPPPPPPTATRLSIVVQPGNTLQSQSITPALQVAAVDNSGETVMSYTGTITVEIATNPSGGVLSGTRSGAAVNGVATFTGLTIDKAGAGYRLRALANGLTSATSNAFEITAPAPPPPPPPPTATRIALVSGNNQTDTVSATVTQPYVVRVTDASGNPVAGVSVVWSVTGGTGGSITPTSAQTNASGLASAIHKLGTSLGTHTVTASATGLQGSPVTFTSTATAGHAAALVFTVQPTSAERNKDIKPDIRVTVHDRLGNTVTSPAIGLTMSIVPLTGTPLASLGGDPTKTTAGGTAVFNNLRINMVGIGYRLRATGGGLSVDSNPFNITLSEEL